MTMAPWLVGAEVRGLHLHFLHLVHVDICRGCSHIARIDDLHAIRRDVDLA